MDRTALTKKTNPELFELLMADLRQREEAFERNPETAPGIADARFAHIDGELKFAITIEGSECLNGEREEAIVFSCDPDAESVRALVISYLEG